MGEMQVSLRSITKYQACVVTAHFKLGDYEQEMQVQTPFDEVNQAMEWARGFFQHFGAQMAMALEQPGSLA